MSRFALLAAFGAIVPTTTNTHGAVTVSFASHEVRPAIVTAAKHVAEHVTAHVTRDGDGVTKDVFAKSIERIVAAPMIAAAPRATYSLRVASMRGPFPEYANDGSPRLTVEITVANTGNAQAPAARLTVHEKDGEVVRNVPDVYVPVISAGGKVTVRVPVAFPTNADGRVCFSSTVEPMVHDDAPAADDDTEIEEISL